MYVSLSLCMCTMCIQVPVETRKGLAIIELLKANFYRLPGSRKFPDKEASYTKEMLIL